MRRSGSQSPAPMVVQQERLKFLDFAIEKTPAGRLNCRVRLSYGEEIIEGSATGTSSPAGDTRLGADAALRALEVFTEATIPFELLGVKVVRAFDSNVVIVSLRYPGQAGRERTLGCYLTDEDPVRGAVFAVLNATNRIISSYLQSR